MTKYNFTINWPKWAQAFRLIFVVIVLSFMFFIAYIVVDGRGFGKGQKEGFALGISKCQKIEAPLLP